MSYVYNKQRIKAKYKGPDSLKTWYIFVIEEVENVFSSSTMERRAFQRIRKQYSEMANLKMCCVSSSQRLQEVSTKFRGKMNYLIGRISIEDFDLKLRRLLRYSKHRIDILNLPLGTFLNAKTDTLIKFPLFKQHGKPYQVFTVTKPKPKPKKKLSIAQRIKHLFWIFDTGPKMNLKIKSGPKTEPEDQDKEFWEEEEEFDNTYWEEWEEF